MSFHFAADASVLLLEGFCPAGELLCPGLGGPGETRGRGPGPEPPGWVCVRPFSLSRRRVVCAGCSLGPRRGSGAGQRAGARGTVGRTRASRGCGSRAPVGSASTSCRSNACSPARRSLSCAGGPSCPLLVRLYGVDQVPPPWNLVSRVHCGKTEKRMMPCRTGVGVSAWPRGGGQPTPPSVTHPPGLGLPVACVS